MKNFIKANLKVLPTVMIFSAVSVYASAVLNANDISYCPGNENLQATDVGTALDLLYSRVDNVPIGTIMSYMGTSAPNNYLICDGSVYNIEDYPKLAEHIKTDFGSYDKFGGNGTTTFAVPDLRGEFLRGAGNNSHTNQGNGAAVGTHQDATEHINLQNYFNGSNSMEFGLGLPSNSGGMGMEKVDTNIGSDQYTYINVSATRRTSDARNQRYTSRPTNTSVNYLIKAN